MISLLTKTMSLISKDAHFYHCRYAVYLIWAALHRIWHVSDLQWSGKASSNLSTTEFDSFTGLFCHNGWKQTYCLQNIVSHFWPKLSHLAARSICDNWAICYAIASLYSFTFVSSAVHPATDDALDSAMVAT